MELKNDLTQLNNIHDLLEDSRKGYLEAADIADNRTVKDMLVTLGTSRAKLIGDVVALARKADPNKSMRDGGTLKGDLHRAWMDIREALGTRDTTAMLNECERGEQFLLDRYDAVLEKDVAPETFALATAQRAVIQKNLDHVKTVRKTLEKIEH